VRIVADMPEISGVARIDQDGLLRRLDQVGVVPLLAVGDVHKKACRLGVSSIGRTLRWFGSRSSLALARHGPSVKPRGLHFQSRFFGWREWLIPWSIYG
jgi:hypothetical protein